MIALVRDRITPYLRKTKHPHPGLLMDKGLVTIEGKSAIASDDTPSKTEHINKICDLPISELYTRAFERWQAHTKDKSRFVRLAMKAESRLFIGLAGSGALETGCALSQCYGMPYIPGSSIKGVVRHWAERHLSHQQAFIKELFGSAPEEEQQLSGLVCFHDAWWIPGSRNPFVREVVTTHHTDYYTSEGNEPASDLDSPVPNSLIAVQGSFLFVLEGDNALTEIAKAILCKALEDNGIGAKTNAGYGYMIEDVDWTEKNLLEGNQKFEAEIAKMKGKKLAIMFTKKGIKKTREKYPDFELLVNTVKKLHQPMIDSWVETNPESNTYIAYQFIKNWDNEKE